MLKLHPLQDSFSGGQALLTVHAVVSPAPLPATPSTWSLLCGLVLGASALH